MYLNVDDLVEQGLVKKKTYTDGKYKGLSVLKYSKKVFWDNLWHLDSYRLLECRGTIIDENNKIIVRPFKKVFNIGENGTQIEDDRLITYPRKVNGFMCAVTRTEDYGLIVSTTGTLDSEYVELAKKWVDTLDTDYIIRADITYLFEVCDKSDPHIVEEDEGIYLIGIRDIEKGNMYLEVYLDLTSYLLKCKRPEVFSGMYKGLPKKVTHEGFMIRDSYSGEILAKTKSPHYLAKKAFMRMGRKRIDLMFNNPSEFKKQIDEEFYDVHEYIINIFSKEEYYELTQEQRRNLFEEYFND